MGRRGLHGCVDGFAGESPHALHGVHVHDRPATTINHGRKECPGDPKQVLKVHGVHGRPGLRIGLVEPDQRPMVAYVVDQHVDPPVFAEHLATEVLYLSIAPDVNHVGPGHSPDSLNVLDDQSRPIGVDLDDLDEGSMLGEQPRDGTTDACSTSGDDSNPTIQ